MSEVKLKEELAKYKNGMEKVFYFMFAVNVLSHVLQNDAVY